MTTPTTTYALLDSGNFRKLERLGKFVIDRPAPQAVWRPALAKAVWQKADAIFIRETGGDGVWKFRDAAIKQRFAIELSGIDFLIQLTDFGHLGIFPEQQDNWLKLSEMIAARRAPTRVLNLFAYTGGSTLACAKAGAEVVHVDASKTSVAWARDNAGASRLADKPVRWIVEDVKKFVGREVKRGSTYHGVILDPPSFGRGNRGETWKIETDLAPLLDDLVKILAKDFLFVLLSSHTPGYTPLAQANILRQALSSVRGTYSAEEMVLRPQGSDVALPSGAFCLFERTEA